MTGVGWWLRIVGVSYLFAGSANVLVATFRPRLFTQTLPYQQTSVVLGAFSDAWLVFALTVLALGAGMVYASAQEAPSRILVVTVILVEISSGVIADAVWIARGHSLAIYGPFIAVHLAIIGSGMAVLRR